jgi:hypothetical protein
VDGDHHSGDVLAALLPSCEAASASEQAGVQGKEGKEGKEKQRKGSKQASAPGKDRQQSATGASKASQGQTRARPRPEAVGSGTPATLRRSQHDNPPYTLLVSKHGARSPVVQHARLILAYSGERLVLGLDMALQQQERVGDGSRQRAVRPRTVAAAPEPPKPPWAAATTAVATAAASTAAEAATATVGSVGSAAAAADADTYAAGPGPRRLRWLPRCDKCTPERRRATEKNENQRKTNKTRRGQ